MDHMRALVLVRASDTLPETATESVGAILRKQAPLFSLDRLAKIAHRLIETEQQLRTGEGTPLPLELALLDLTTTELADRLVGGVLAAGPDRLEVAGRSGIPQVVSLGALDMVNFGARDTVPPQFESRNLYVHNPSVTLMRTTPEECAELGRIIARKLADARGPTALFIPLGGVSAIDVEGAPFYDPAADRALFSAVRENLTDNVELHELDHNINDREFATAMVAKLVEYLGEAGVTRAREAAP